MAAEEAEMDGQSGEGEPSGQPAKTPPVLNQRVPNQFPLELDGEQVADPAVAAEPEPANHHSVHVYDLFKNPFCVATLVFLSLLLAYYVFDSLPLGETYVAGFPYGLFAVAGAGCALLVYAINFFGGVPRIITLGLAVTAAVAGLMAAHPALLRINAMTDDGAIQMVEYVRTTQNHFDPLEGGWPAIDMIGRHYWLVVPGEVSRNIPIRRGGLGFYQADLTEIRFELELSEAFGQPD